ncbi:hypothetical protein NADFUDRAFT_45914 [Nadsonia fulvescens var. elongata DSM 6958]|uniref:Uncharacterized protein n=1 Tax=Nadsonia fulvescens var. elongata DSM 6958 TaxID=857566 RepID=A0A1E3PMN2_9ASCO|nr:hypothetical protein NADFUDRAFT_45914 [Nadsonia fulvescens var. elongata DSM 6958]
MIPHNRRCVLAGVATLSLTVFTILLIWLSPVDIHAAARIPLSYVSDDYAYELEELYTNIRTGELYRSAKELAPWDIVFPDFEPSEDPESLWNEGELHDNTFLSEENAKFINDQAHSLYYGNSNSEHNDKILILSASDGKGNSEINNVLGLSMANREEYANMHGYVNYFVNISQFDLGKARPVWGKIPAILKAWEDYPDVEWVWWLDSDVIITNPYIDIYSYLLDPEALEKKITWGRPLRYRRGMMNRGKYFADAAEGNMDIEKDINFIISQDSYGLNAGSFFIKKTPWAKKILLELWKNPYFMIADTSLYEQDILQSLVLDHKSLTLRHVGFVTQRAINAYSDTSRLSGTWKPNDFVVHFAGCKARGGGGLCQNEWNKYYNLRTRVPEEFRVSEDWTYESH